MSCGAGYAFQAPSEAGDAAGSAGVTAAGSAVASPSRMTKPIGLPPRKTVPSSVEKNAVLNVPARELCHAELQLSAERRGERSQRLRGDPRRKVGRDDEAVGVSR